MKTKDWTAETVPAIEADFRNPLIVALVKAQKEIKSAVKDSQNPFFKSHYADLHSVWAACRKALNDNGLAVSQTIDFEGSTHFLRTILLHESGERIEGRCPLINLKGDMQSLGSAVSYARRYSLAAICGVVSEEDDDGNLADNKSGAHQKQTANIGSITGDHIITFGKYKGKKVKEIQQDELLSYCTFLRTVAKTQGKEFGGEPKAIEDYLSVPHDPLRYKDHDEMPNPFED